MTSNNPYLSTWFRPSETLNKILTRQIKFNYRIPILLSAISMFLGELSGNMDLGVGFAIILFFIGLILYYLFLTKLIPWLIIKIGLIWGGKSGHEEMVLVIGLAQVPVLLILLEQIIFLGFGKIIPDTSVNILIQWIAWIFYLRILIIGIAKVQGFTYSMALLNIAITFLPFLLISLLR